MRIISGYLKGKKINLPKDKLTRPLKDMVKESIFNIIEHSSEINYKVADSVILDLFSGSGSFGLECISRGAKFVFFCENYQNSINILEKNIKDLKCEDKCEILKNSSFDISKNFKESANIIFMDPPFKEKNINLLIEKIYEMKILKKNGTMIIHRNKKIDEDFSPKFKIIDTRYYGLSKIIFGI
jgi:16S rRNA (guanine966-N2)-methyltransferase